MDTAAPMAPADRIRRVRALVSMPSIPTTPASARCSPSDPCARQDEARRLASRTANPATCTRQDSTSDPLTP